MNDSLMFQSKLEVLKGRDGVPNHIYNLKIDPAEEALFPNKVIPPGLVFSRHTDGDTAKLGAAGGKVPFFMQDMSNRPMTSLMGTPATDASAALGGYIGGGSRRMNFYCGLGNFEVSSTEFKDATYAVDDPLTANGFAVPGTYDADAGRVQKTTWTGAANIVGIVSKPYSSVAPTKNRHGSKALFFTTCFIPNRKVTAGS